MSESSEPKKFDLEERTFKFNKDVVLFLRTLPKNISNTEYIKQLSRSAGSMGANYIEANESLSKKDFLMRVKICRKESKETVYWLRLLKETNDILFEKESDKLINEAGQLKKIFSSIIEKSN